MNKKLHALMNEGGFSEEQGKRILKILEPVAKELPNDVNPHPKQPPVQTNNEPPDTDPNSPPTKP